MCREHRKNTLIWIYSLLIIKQTSLIEHFSPNFSASSQFLAISTTWGMKSIFQDYSGSWRPWLSKTRTLYRNCVTGFGRDVCSSVGGGGETNICSEFGTSYQQEEHFFPSVFLPSLPLTNGSLPILENLPYVVEISGNWQLVRADRSVELAWGACPKL